MGALFAVLDAATSDRAASTEALRRSLRAQGFGGERSWAWPGGALHWFATPGDDGGGSRWVEQPDGFIASVGTVFVDGLGGAPALDRLWHAIDGPDDVARLDLWGSFLVAVGKHGRVLLFGDPIGMVKLYRVPARRIVCTSWLACVVASGSRLLDRLGSQEFVLLGANHGDRTPVQGVGIVDPAAVVEPTADSVHRPRDAGRWRERSAPGRIEDAVDACAIVLRRRMTAIGASFDRRINTALSGGFDSRLIVAALHAAGHAPALFVYGHPMDDDVRIARSIAAAQGWPIRHVDKATDAGSRAPLELAGLRESMHFFDGIPTDGLFDRGPDRETRIQQSARGAIALNGGGGEILRNFFYLPDRPLDTLDVVHAFYHGFLPTAFVRRGERDDFIAAMRAAIREQTDSGDALDRTGVELVYPLVRARYWTSRNNSLAARCGHFATPLLDPELVRISAALPIRWKDYGRLESRLITTLWPPLGRHALSYGFTPEQGPTRGYRASMWLQHHRPPLLRAHSARIKRLLRRAAVPAAPDDATRLLAGPLAVRSLLDPQGLVEGDQVARLMSLEALVRLLPLDVPD